SSRYFLVTDVFHPFVHRDGIVAFQAIGRIYLHFAAIDGITQVLHTGYIDQSAELLRHKDGVRELHQYILFGFVYCPDIQYLECAFSRYLDGFFAVVRCRDGAPVPRYYEVVRFIAPRYRVDHVGRQARLWVMLPLDAIRTATLRRYGQYFLDIFWLLYVGKGDATG